jgi:hypothetical protein
VEDSQNAADDGEAQRDEQVKRTEEEGVNQDNLESAPHESVTPSSELSKDRQMIHLRSRSPNKLSCITNENILQALLEKKGTSTYTKYRKKKSRKKLGFFPISLAAVAVKKYVEKVF